MCIWRHSLWKEESSFIHIHEMNHMPRTTESRGFLCVLSENPCLFDDLKEITKLKVFFVNWINPSLPLTKADLWDLHNRSLIIFSITHWASSLPFKLADDGFLRDNQILLSVTSASKQKQCHWLRRNYSRFTSVSWKTPSRNSLKTIWLIQSKFTILLKVRSKKKN